MLTLMPDIEQSGHFSNVCLLFYWKRERKRQKTVYRQNIYVAHCSRENVRSVDLLLCWKQIQRQKQTHCYSVSVAFVFLFNGSRQSNGTSFNINCRKTEYNHKRAPSFISQTPKKMCFTCFLVCIRAIASVLLFIWMLQMKEVHFSEEMPFLVGRSKKMVDCALQFFNLDFIWPESKRARCSCCGAQQRQSIKKEMH